MISKFFTRCGVTVFLGLIKTFTLLSCLTFSCSCFTCSCVFPVLFLSVFILFSASCPHDYIRGSPPSSLPSRPSPTSLCSGDNPEQRSAASWQRPPTVLALSGDHQRDLHPCACAKLAGGLPQSHTHHHGVCVATHVPASSPPPAVFPLSVCSALFFFSCPRCVHAIYLCFQSIPIAKVYSKFVLFCHFSKFLNSWWTFIIVSLTSLIINVN